MPIKFNTTPIATDTIRQYRIIPTLFGPLALIAQNNILTQLIFLFHKKNNPDTTLKKRFPHAKPNNKLLPELSKQLQTYFKTGHANFTATIDLSWASPFTAKALRACAQIPTAKTISYQQLATAADSPNASRAAGLAMAKNRTPIIIPCHRVIAANGKLTGYSAPGGLPLKKQLLTLEQYKP